MKVNAYGGNDFLGFATCCSTEQRIHSRLLADQLFDNIGSQSFVGITQEIELLYEEGDIVLGIGGPDLRRHNPHDGPHVG